MKKALISVSDKNGIVDFAQKLTNLGYEIISTGGTKTALEQAGLNTLSISEITGFPEIMDGRVKTLHPNVHGALLCVRDNPDHCRQLQENHIDFIDMVVVNLYPFKESLKNRSGHDELIENIDIGGPSMLRSAAKNYQSVTVITDPSDYDTVIGEIEDKGDTDIATRERLAAKVFRHTSAYDALIAGYLTQKIGEDYPESLTLTFEKKQDLRYGENPHQNACFYQESIAGLSIANAEQLHGKELSYNNIQDANAAIEILKEFNSPSIVAVKHMNPCGVGVADDITEAWDKAYNADPVSIFGGIVASNRTINSEVAHKISELFLEIVIAPDFDKDAYDIIAKKKNIRILKLDMAMPLSSNIKIVSVMGGLLVQDLDNAPMQELEYATLRKPTEQEMDDLLFTWKVVKHVHISNACFAMV